MNEAISDRTIDTIFGTLHLRSSARGLTHIQFQVPADHDPTDAILAPLEHLDRAEQQLQEYFAGTRQAFDLSLDPSGTAFQRSVWTALTEIPYGHICSYGQIAQRIDHASAPRAVGAANGANPLPIVVPCHRVVGTDLRLTGYAGGLDRKRWLLEHEGVVCEGDRVVAAGQPSLHFGEGRA